MRRRGIEALSTRLAKRESQGVPSGSMVAHSRHFFENIIPNQPVLLDLSNDHSQLSIFRFTPCGKYMIAFSPVRSEVNVYKYVGVEELPSLDNNNINDDDSSGLAHKRQRLASNGGGGGAPSAAAAAAAAVPPPPPPPPPLPSQQQQNQSSPPTLPFSTVFPHHFTRYLPSSSSSTHGLAPLHPELVLPFCLVIAEKFLLLATATHPATELSQSAILQRHQQQQGGGGGGEGGLTHAALLSQDRRARDTIFHLLDLNTGNTLDRYTVANDAVELTRHGAVSLIVDIKGNSNNSIGGGTNGGGGGTRLLILGQLSQNMHIMTITKYGKFSDVEIIGQHCLPEDGEVIDKQQQDEAVFYIMNSSNNEDDNGGGASSRKKKQMKKERGDGDPNSDDDNEDADNNNNNNNGRDVTPPAMPPPDPPWAPSMGIRSVDRNRQGQLVDSTNNNGRRGGLQGGLKQRLLARLYLEAACGGTVGTGNNNNNNGGGSPNSNHNNSNGAISMNNNNKNKNQMGSSSSGSGSGSGDMQTLKDQQRQPLGKFYFNYEAYSELLLSSAEFIDSNRIILEWVYPELLLPLTSQHRLSAAAAATVATAVAAAYTSYTSSSAIPIRGLLRSVYNLKTTRMEKIFNCFGDGATGPQEWAQFVLDNPTVLMDGVPSGGEQSGEWERFVNPEVVSRRFREASLRVNIINNNNNGNGSGGGHMNGTTTTNNNNNNTNNNNTVTIGTDSRRRRAALLASIRPTDVMPWPSQARQVSPYLDPDLYEWDDRLVLPSFQGCPIPQRALKFVAKSRPEKARFRLEPEAFAPRQGFGLGGRNYRRRGGGGGGGGGAQYGELLEVKYLFHPRLPVLLVIVEDRDTGCAERVTMYTRY